MEAALNILRQIHSLEDSRTTCLDFLWETVLMVKVVAFLLDLETTQVSLIMHLAFLLVLITSDIPGPALISSTTQSSTARGPTPTRSPALPSQVPSKPDYTAFSAFGASYPISQSPTPQPVQSQQQQSQPTQPQARVVDPFAALKTSTQQSPPQQPQKSIFDFANPQPPANPPAASGDDDEWAFSSALPEGPPSSNTLTVSDTSLSISLHATREPPTPALITMSLSFSNKTAQPVSELTFMAAVEKASRSLIISQKVSN